MGRKGEMSSRKAWLLVLVSLLDDAILLGLIILGLWYFDVEISWPLIVILALVAVVLFFVIHRAVIPSLRRCGVTGAEGMVGQKGEVTAALTPAGVVRVSGEYWQAKSIDGDIKEGDEVEIVSVDRLQLEVKRRHHDE